MSALIFRKIRLNALANSYSQAVTIALQLVLVPFFLMNWGASLYADWIVLSGLPTILVLLDFGVAQTSTSQALMFEGKKDRQLVKTVLQNSFVFTVFVGILISFVPFILSFLVDWVSLLNLKLIGNRDAENILTFLAINLFVQMLGGPLEGWFKVIDRAALGAFLSGSRRTLDFILGILLLNIGGTPIQLACATFVFQLILFFINLLVVNRLSNWRMFDEFKVDFSEFKKILRPSISYMSFPISQMITIQGGVQVLNQLSTANTLIAFNMTRTLVRMMLQVGMVASNSIRPELSKLLGSNDLVNARRVSFKVTKITLFLVVFMYVALILFGPFIVSLWSHHVVDVDRITLGIVGLHAVVNTAWFVSGSLIVSANAHSRLAFLYFISSMASITVWIVFRNVVEPVMGAAFLLLIPELIMIFSYTYWYSSPLSKLFGVHAAKRR